MTASLGTMVLKVPGNVEVCVPATLENMMTYCLAEQEDWFEKEITFVRRMLEPAMTVVDVGANYGLYSLAAARAVGPQGVVWSFEPASAVLPYLRESIARNDFAQIRIVDAAVADEQGTGLLELARDPALNRLQPLGAQSGEPVHITTLDHEQITQGWSDVGFVKLDAEGAERAILRGGRNFLTHGSPLVMFERVHDGAVDDGIAQDFRGMGWGIFRLTNPEGYLVPLKSGQSADPLELNLFACKQARMVQLAERGLLVVDSSHDIPIAPGAGLALLQQQAFWPVLASRINGESDSRYIDVLDAFAVARNQDCALEERWAALRRAVELAKSFGPQPVTPAMCSTIARIAFEAGEYRLMMDALQAVLRAYPNRNAPVIRPLWPACPRYDAIDPASDVVTWFHAAIIEQFERARRYSSRFGGPETLPLLDWLQSTRFASHEMERRRTLIRLVNGLKAERTPLLTQGGEGCLNREIWLPDGQIGAQL